MPGPIQIADLNNAKTDVDHIADFANSASLTATDRLGGVKRTLAGVLADIDEATAAAEALMDEATGEVATAAATATTKANEAAASAVASEEARDQVEEIVQGNFLADGAGAGPRTFPNKNRDIVSACDYFADGSSGVNVDPEGVVDSTGGIQAALNTGKDVYFPPGVYKQTADLLSTGGSVFGPGKIRWAKDSGLELEIPASLAQVKPDAQLRVCWVESAWDLADLLAIKYLGFNTILHYGFFENEKTGETEGSWAELLANAEALNLQVIMGTQYTGATAAGATTLGEASSAVIGYAMYDEPVGNGITAATQDIKIAEYRALTKKLLCVTEYDPNGIRANPVDLSDGYDVVFMDVYSTDVSLTVDKQNAMLAYGSLRYKCPRASIIPVCSLHESPSSTEDQTRLTEFTLELAKIGPNGSFGVFCWDGYGAPTISARIRDTSYLRALASRLVEQAKFPSGIVIETYAWGTGAELPLGDLLRIYSEHGSANAKPSSVVDVGAATDDRQQDFAIRGVRFGGVGGTFMTRIASLGRQDAWLYFDNQGAAATADVYISSSPDDGYTVTARASSLTMADGSNAKLTAAAPKREALALQVNLSAGPSGTAAATAWAGNTGNGAMGAITVAATAKAGTWRLMMIEPATNGGRYLLEDPDGLLLDFVGVVGAPYSNGGLSFTLADGATDFVAGDGFNIVVSKNDFRWIGGLLVNSNWV